MYHWNSFLSNWQLLSETKGRPFTYIVHEHQLYQYGCKAWYLKVNPTPQVVSVRDKLKWWSPMGCPQTSWLEHVDRSCYELYKIGNGVYGEICSEEPLDWVVWKVMGSGPVAHVPVDGLINCYRFPGPSKDFPRLPTLQKRVCNYWMFTTLKILLKDSQFETWEDIVQNAAVHLIGSPE